MNRFTLFDCIDDDEFDGDIGEHDDEVPRVLVTFRIEPASVQQSQVNTLTSFHVGDIEKVSSNYTSILTDNVANLLANNGETPQKNPSLADDKLSKRALD